MDAVMNHKVKYTKIDEGKHKGRCTCGWTSGIEPLASKQLCEDEFWKHEREVERLRARLSNRTPSLKTSYTYYMEQANNEELSVDDRRLWQQLADELKHRLPEDDPSAQTALF